PLAPGLGGWATAAPPANADRASTSIANTDFCDRDIAFPPLSAGVDWSTTRATNAICHGLTAALLQAGLSPASGDARIELRPRNGERPIARDVRGKRTRDSERGKRL